MSSSVIIRQLSESNDRTTQAINRIGRQIEATNDSVQMIHAAVELITSIASQTSLLALNASIEAARAGEHGKGFAVVASEIQKLAEQSNDSAEKIKDIIRDLLSEAEQTVNVMHEVEDIVAQQQEKLEETKTKFVSVADGIECIQKRDRGNPEFIRRYVISQDPELLMQFRIYQQFHRKMQQVQNRRQHLWQV